MTEKLKVILCWHMHQPYYQDHVSATYQLPWTYLHSIKDYVDMAWHLENSANAKAVVNFAPTLLEQIDDYDQQFQSYFKGTGKLKDPLLVGLGSNVMPVGDRLTLVKACLRANEEKLIKPFPHFSELVDTARWLLEAPHRLHYVSDQFISDLLVWYHLVWMAESVRREDSRIQKLMKKEQLYSFQDRWVLMSVMGELIHDLLPRYKALSESGRIELSVTPYAHPILPLLLDINSTKEAMPDAQLPNITHYPGGRERAHWHMEEGLRVFESFFGFRPIGCWPSEGAVSEEALALIAEHGFKWAATGENVLRNSLSLSDINDANIHKPYRLKNQSIACFFRDDGLSDLIGFTYTKWRADDAVNDFINHLLKIKQETEDDENTVVSVILDGENAWEYYSYNGYYFLKTLYACLADHPEIELTTFSDCLADGVQSTELPKMMGGSWVYGSYSTWIGDKDKNYAWDLVSEAKIAYDQVLATNNFTSDQRRRIERQLAICEGSDWFWWYGDYNSSESVRDFEQLHRSHLTTLYLMLGLDVPDSLSKVISYGGGGMEQGGTMRRGSE